MNRKHIVEAISKSMAGMKPGIEVLLYGSEARNESREDSDMDIIILIDKENVSVEEELAITTPLYDIELNSGVIINTLIIPKKDWGKRITPFYENVIRDAVAI